MWEPTPDAAVVETATACGCALRFNAILWMTTIVVRALSHGTLPSRDHAPAHYDGGSAPIGGPICRDQDSSPMSQEQPPALRKGATAERCQCTNRKGGSSGHHTRSRVPTFDDRARARIEPVRLSSATRPPHGSVPTLLVPRAHNDANLASAGACEGGKP